MNVSKVTLGSTWQTDYLSMNVLVTVVTYRVVLPPSYHLIQNSSALNTETEVHMGPAGLKRFTNSIKSVTSNEEHLDFLRCHILFSWCSLQRSAGQPFCITVYIFLLISFKAQECTFYLMRWRSYPASNSTYKRKKSVVFFSWTPWQWWTCRDQTCGLQFIDGLLIASSLCLHKFQHALPSI